LATRTRHKGTGQVLPARVGLSCLPRYGPVATDLTALSRLHNCTSSTKSANTGLSFLTATYQLADSNHCLTCVTFPTVVARVAINRAATASHSLPHSAGPSNTRHVFIAGAVPVLAAGCLCFLLAFRPCLVTQVPRISSRAILAGSPSIPRKPRRHPRFQLFSPCSGTASRITGYIGGASIWRPKPLCEQQPFESTSQFYPPH